MIMAGVMTDFTGDEIKTQCLTMGPYLLGLGLGSSWGDKIKEVKQITWLFRFEWASVAVLPVIPVLQLLTVFLVVNLSPAGMTLENKNLILTLLLCTSVLAFIAGTLGGAQLPIILKREKTLSQEIILAINYTGPLLAGFCIVGLNQSAAPIAVQIYIVGIIQLIGLFALVFMSPRRLRSLLFLIPPLGILIATTIFYPVIERYTVKSTYLGSKTSLKDLLHPATLLNTLEKFGTVERVRTPYQTIDLFIEPPQLEYSIPGNATLYLNRKPQFDMLSVAVYHESMLYSGLNLLKHSPKKILILGGGDGLLLTELRKHPNIPEITMVELDEGMLNWSRDNGVISQINKGALDNIPKNVHLIVGDGITFLRNSKEKYDLMLIDFPFPNGYDLAKLYSYEFYRLVKHSLAPEGIVILDIPIYLEEKSGDFGHETLTIIKTMRAAGFKNPFLFGPSASFIALKVSDEPLSFDYNNFPEGLTLASYQNLINPFREEDIDESVWKKTSINTMFWPRGL